MEEFGGLNLRKCSPEELEDLTDNFSEANLIGKTQFGRVFRGKTQQGQDVTVKIWEVGGIYYLGKNENRAQLMAECTFLKEPSVNHHPNLAKLMGYCSEDSKDSLLGAVYDLKPLDTLRHLIVKDNFSWLQRIKVAIGFARLLAFLHGLSPYYVVRNIDAAHIMLDQDYYPIVFDFGMLTGGVLGDKTSEPNKIMLGSFGYIDPLTTTGVFVRKNDVFSFGNIYFWNSYPKESMERRKMKFQFLCTFGQRLNTGKRRNRRNQSSALPPQSSLLCTKALKKIWGSITGMGIKLPS